MDHPPKAAEPEAKAKAFAAAVSNGALRKHRPPPPPPPPEAADDLLYRECLKNHAASLGGHALDGCGEFLLSPAADPADPTSLRCAACGCHRNFHRRLLDPLFRRHHHHHRPEGEDELDGTEDDEEDDVDEEEKIGGSGGCPRPRRSSPSPPPLFYSSAPHMLLALSAGLPGGVPLAPAPVRPAAAQPRKRFRTKFSPEQKGRMQELSERLGWRMQKRDEGLVEECCREIGVDKGVFKVWMHNNKHTFFGLARRGGDAATAAAGRNGGSVGVGGRIEGTDRHRANGGDGGGDDGDGGNGHVVNGSFSPS